MSRNAPNDGVEVPVMTDRCRAVMTSLGLDSSVASMFGAGWKAGSEHATGRDLPEEFTFEVVAIVDASRPVVASRYD